MNRRHRFRACRALYIAALMVGFAFGGRSSAASINGNVGTRAFPSLKIGVGAEAIAMGSAGVALADDAYAPYWNVAGLAHLGQTQIALMNNAWLLDLRQSYAAIAEPLGDSGGIAAFASFLDYGELVGRDATGAETGTFRPYDLVTGIGLAFSPSSGLSIGVQGKYLRQVIDDASAAGFGADAGLRYDVPNSGVSLGAAIQHLGTSMKFDRESFSLPTTVRVGIGYRVREDAAALALDVVFPFDNDPAIGAGVSYDFLNTISVRGGYRYQIGGNELGTVAGLAGGFGLHLSGLALDYAFVSYGDLGPTNRISLSARF